MIENYLKQAELIREHIHHLLPEKGPIDVDKLNINIAQLIDVPKSINTDIPVSMAALFAIYNMANFVSQFQFKILLDDVKVPTNTVGFLLASSGLGKDSTVTAQKQAMDSGFAMIESYREKKAQERAQRKAEEEGEDNWQKFVKKPLPLENSISTVEGLVARLNTFSKDGIGMPSIYESELGSALGSNPNIIDNIRLLAVLYDLGNYKSKAIKDQERQDQEVIGMGMNALFVGSEDNIILDKTIAQKFKIEFVTKLARRSLFVYPSKKEFKDAMIEYNSYEDMKKKTAVFEMQAKSAKAYIGNKTMEIAERFLDSETKLLTIDEDALDIYKDYKMYCNALGNGLDYLYKSVQLEQTHRSWKMLKLAGVFAMWDLRANISSNDIEEAIYIVEKFGRYMEEYELYASKFEYEHLVDFFIDNPEYKFSLHELKKRGFINGTSNLNGKVNELVRLADSYAGNRGMVEYKGDIVSWKPFEKVGDHGASYLQVSGSKSERAVKSHSGFIYQTTSFDKLANLMNNDTAYTPFKFKDGKRSNVYCAPSSSAAYIVV